MRKKIVSFFIILIIIFIANPSFASDTIILEIGEEKALSYSGYSEQENGVVKKQWNITNAVSNNNNVVTCKLSGGRVTVKAVESGTAKVSIIYSTTNVRPETKIVEQEIKVVSEEKKAFEEAKDTLDDMKNAYKNIPTKDATAEKIDRFIKSDAAYNDLKNLKNISKETAEKWKETIYNILYNNPLADTITRDMYYETYRTLESYVAGDNKEVDNKKDILSDKMNASVEATEKTILAMAKDLEGEDRAHTTFVDVISNMNNYIPTNQTQDPEITKKASIALTLITNIGIILSVLMIAIIGIKYMLGSIEEKAEYKKDLIPYLVGAILLFGITAIVKILQLIGQNFNNL